jgi:hypothetical protein
LVISLSSGAIGGYFASFDIFNPVHALFRDDDHFYDVIHKYPKSYLQGTDEHYHETKSTLVQIKEFLQIQQSAHQGDEAFSFKTMASNVWHDHKTAFDAHLNKLQTKKYLNEMLISQDPEFEMTDDVFE